AGFNPRYVYLVNNSGGTFYVDRYDLSIPFVNGVSDPKTFVGSVAVGAATGVLSGGTNPGNDEFALDNSNTVGVAGLPNPPGDPSTATTGVEGKIKLSEIGVTGSTCKIRLAAMLSGTDGGGRSYLSNQSLPTYFVPTTQNVMTDPVNGTTTQPFDFGDATVHPLGDPFQGNPAFAGNQFAEIEIGRKLGDIVDQGNCCINAADTVVFVQ